MKQQQANKYEIFSLCVFCIRKRQRNAATPMPIRVRKEKKPALRRAEARERLKQFTESSDVSSEPKSTVDGQTETREQVPAVAETSSISEQEWYALSNLSTIIIVYTKNTHSAICLSTLHAPAPPEPALLAPTNNSPIDEAATQQPMASPTSTESSSDPEAILKLHTCSHTFHAECLVSWFVLRKTTCPICRTAYISKEDMQAYEEEEAAETAPAEQLTVVEPPAAAAQGSAGTVTNWRYFWAGESVRGRENALAATQRTDVEGGGQSRGRGLRFWRR
jgi:hypothetical protein